MNPSSPSECNVTERRSQRGRLWNRRDVIMRIPVPTNKLVAFTLAGALLTMVVAGGLAVPGLGLASPSDTASAATGTNGSVAQQVAADAPTPNQNFTPAVQTQSGYEEGEHEGEEHEEDEEDEEGEHEEGEEGEE